jgi:uncharacterized membrane protein YhiD involved in acid resistance
MMNLFQDWQSILSSTIGQAIANMTVALACGFLISLLYRWTYRGPNYSIKLINSIPPLSMITAVVIMVIGNNLARAFGLVGALSIIRFRTAIKDMQDIVFIFFSLAVGMAAGVGLHPVAITGTIFIGASTLILSKIHYASLDRREFLLQFRFTSSFTSSGEQEAPYLPILGEYCKQHKLINVRSLRNGDVLELSYYVNLKAKDRSEEFVRRLGRVQDVSHANLFFDEEQF